MRLRRKEDYDCKVLLGTMIPNEEEDTNRSNWFSEVVRSLWRTSARVATATPYIDYVENFRKADCINFVPEVIDDLVTDRCHCGLKASLHYRLEGLRELDGEFQTHQSQRDTDWSPTLYLHKDFPTDSFGLLSFHGDGQDFTQPAHFLRLADDSRISPLKFESDHADPSVLTLFKKYWSFLEPQRPRLVISIAGGTSASGIDGTQKEKLLGVLIKAVKTTNACLVTDGLDSGYTRLVGRAVARAQFLEDVRGKTVPEIKCIGIVPYGLFRGKGISFNEHGGLLRLEGWDAEDYCALNKNHTHLLLVDDGYSNEKAKADDFRARLLEKMQKAKPEGFGIPVVVMLMEGGPGAIEECYKSMNRLIPLLVVEGTGRAADLLAYISRRYTLPMEVGDGGITARQSHTGEQLQEIQQEVVRFLPDLNDAEIEECTRNVVRCCEMGQLITIFDINSDTNIDKYILGTLIKGRSNPFEQLRLAMQWDRVDVAEERIFPHLRLEGRNTAQLNSIMTMALLQEKRDFVEFLLQVNVVMSEFLTVPKLRDLYNKAPQDSHLRHLLDKTDDNISLIDVHNLFEKLVGKHEHELYEQDHPNAWENKKFDDPYLELLLWAMVSRRGQLALYLWDKCRSPLGAAVVARSLYRSLGKSLPDRETDLKKEYTVMQDVFEKKAVELLNTCYKEDRSKALILVENGSPRWGNLHAMDIALMAHDMRFISTTCCQESVSRMWKNVKWKFIFRQIYRLIIMMIQIYFVLSSLTYSISLLEVFMLGLFIFDFIEKIIEANLAMSMVLWLSPWNIFDLTSDVIYFIGFGFRFIPIKEAFFATKVSYAVSSLFLCFRVFRIYYVSSRLGPMIIVFIYMIPKLLQFAAFLVILLLGYGITSRVLLYHPCDKNEAFWSVETLDQIFFKPYWHMFGELMLDDIQAHNYTVCQNRTWDWGWRTSCDTCEPSDDDPDCVCLSSSQAEQIGTKTLLSFYLIMSNILLLNLVIAIFTNVFEFVQEKSSEHWKFEMYRLTREYKMRSLIPLPFGIPIYMWKLIQKLRNRSKQASSYIPMPNELSIRIFEQNNANVEVSQQKKAPTDEFLEVLERITRLEQNMTSTRNRIEGMMNVRQSQETASNTAALESIMASLRELVDLPEKINLLEEHLRSSQMRLEAEQALQSQDIKSIKRKLGRRGSMISSAVPSSMGDPPPDLENP